jgi:hypothetical protein
VFDAPLLEADGLEPDVVAVFVVELVELPHAEITSATASKGTVTCPGRLTLILLFEIFLSRLKNFIYFPL